jgi:hypothetical protein
MLALALLAPGVYAHVAEARAISGGNRPPVASPQPTPPQLTQLPELVSLATRLDDQVKAAPDLIVDVVVVEPEESASPLGLPLLSPLEPAECRIANKGDDVLPRVREVACFLDTRFPEITSILGRGPRQLAGSDHPKGLAVDFMVGDQSELGDEIADCAADHFDDWGLKYIIWEQEIMSESGEEFREMEDRGSDTANHRDHVHLSFTEDLASSPPDEELDC